MISIYTTLLLVAAPLAAQSVGGDSEMVYQWGGGNAYVNNGNSVASAGDVNADGFDDIIVGDPLAKHAGPTAGAADVYSGLDGTLLYRWNGNSLYDSFGHAVAGAGDVNADGFDDLLVGAHKAANGYRNAAGMAYIYSGADGSLLYDFGGADSFDGFGRSLAGAGDVNADGFADVVIGAQAADPNGIPGSGSAYVYSGFNGALLFQANGVNGVDAFGTVVSTAGDVNADGFSDIIIGAPFTDIPSGLSDAGSAYVYSGANGSLLYRWNGTVLAANLGAAVAFAGDVNQDGFSDVIVGIPDTYIQQGPYNAGTARIYSGFDGAVLQEWHGTAHNHYFGSTVANAGDVNGDGFDELLIGAPDANPNGRSDAGSVFLFSSATGALLHQWDGVSEDDRFGASLASAGDTNADGYSEVVIGAPDATVNAHLRSGSAQVFNFKPFLYIDTYSASAASGATLQLELDFPTAAAFDRYKVLLSAAGIGPTNFGVDVPLALDSMVWQSYFGSYPTPLTSNMHGTLDGSGNASATFTLPAGINPALIGSTYHFAAIANQFGQLPEYSSIAIPLSITP